MYYNRVSGEEHFGRDSSLMTGAFVERCLFRVFTYIGTSEVVIGSFFIIFIRLTFHCS